MCSLIVFCSNMFRNHRTVIPLSCQWNDLFISSRANEREPFREWIEKLRKKFEIASALQLIGEGTVTINFDGTFKIRWNLIIENKQTIRCFKQLENTCILKNSFGLVLCTHNNSKTCLMYERRSANGVECK